MNSELAQQILEQTRHSYNVLADKFSNTRKWEWPIMQDLVAQYVKAGQKILDIGCGNGRLYQILKDKNIDYLGIDNSQKLIKLAKQTGGQFQVKDILNLGFNQEYDVVFAFAVVSHLPSQELRLQALKNIYQALKPGGLLLMTNWNLWQLNFKYKTVWRYKIKKFQVSSFKFQELGFKDVMTYFNDGQGKKYPLYYYAFTLRELKWLVKKVGFEVVEGYFEKKGEKTSWLKGNNIVLVCRKK